MELWRRRWGVDSTTKFRDQTDFILKSIFRLLVRVSVNEGPITVAREGVFEWEPNFSFENLSRCPKSARTSLDTP